MLQNPRHEAMNVCATCRRCDGSYCAPVRQRLRAYDGIRFTSDGFDCALPVSIDSHSFCSFACLYCFSNNLLSHRQSTGWGVGQTSLRSIENLFAGEGKRFDVMRKALKYDDRRNGYPGPVQLGALNDPCDYIEQQQGWLLRYLELAIKYNQPTRISTKGVVLAQPDYLRVLERAPHLFWVAFSIVSPDDSLVRKIDRKAPVPSERLATMKALSGIGVKTSLRLRPMLAGVTWGHPANPYAYRELIAAAAEAGARAVSYEVAFTPGAPTNDVRARWKLLSDVTGFDHLGTYAKFGQRACVRPAAAWTRAVMHDVRDVAHRHGMVVGISDPVWKELGDTGCCCGIMPDDPVFGNWQRESATNQLLRAKATGTEIGPQDITPPWAYSVPWDNMVPVPAGPLKRHKRKYYTWADFLRDLWNDPQRERSPYQYFQGALRPTRIVDGDVFYTFHSLDD